MKNKKTLSTILNILVIISSVIGLIYTFKGREFMSTSALYYYTIQSNIWVILIMLIFIFCDIFKIKKGRILYKIKYIITVGITLTFLVFLFMLTPQIIITGNPSYLLSASNLTLHFISPILAILSFVLCDSFKEGKRSYYLGTIMPLCYMAFAFILAFTSKTGMFRNFDGSMSKFPYFFFDYEKNGWFSITNNIFEFGTFYWIILLSIVVILIGKLFINLNIKANKNSK